MTERKLGRIPYIDPTARVRDSTLGTWTAVGARTSVQETVMGDYSYVANDSDIIYAEIGKFCSIAGHTRLNPGNHPLWKAALHHFSYRSPSYKLCGDEDEEFFNWRRKHKVILGHDVWIGHGAVILPGVTIGTGAAVGAGAVVAKDVAPFTIAAGVPAKPIRRRVNAETEAALQRIEWWHWPHERLAKAIPDFRSLNAEAFAEKYDR